jgi:hypothetical protein
MAKYRRTMIEVDAFCYGHEDFPAWFQELVNKKIALLSDRPESIGSWVRLKTLNGEVVGFRGDWVVRDSDGDVSFWEHDLFVKTYEPITQS